MPQCWLHHSRTAQNRKRGPRSSPWDMQETGNALHHPRMIPRPVRSRSKIGACSDGGFGWVLCEIRFSREDEAASGQKYISEAVRNRAGGWKALSGAASRTTSLRRPFHLRRRPQIWTISWLEAYAGQAVTTPSLSSSIHLTASQFWPNFRRRQRRR